MSDLDQSSVFTQSFFYFFLLQARGGGSKKIFITLIISLSDSYRPGGDGENRSREERRTGWVVFKKVFQLNKQGKKAFTYTIFFLKYYFYSFFHFWPRYLEKNWRSQCNVFQWPLHADALTGVTMLTLKIWQGNENEHGFLSACFCSMYDCIVLLRQTDIKLYKQQPQLKQFLAQ